MGLTSSCMPCYKVFVSSTGVLGVPGGPFSLLLPRSKDFEEFEVLMRILYPDPVDYITSIGAMDLLWSRLEPAGYMSYITEDPLPGTPTHRVLYQYGLGDAQVNILGLYAIARSARAVMFESNVRCQFLLPDTGQVVTEKLFGFPLLPDDTTVTQDVVAVGFDCGAPPEPADNIPPNAATDTHEGPRRSPLAQEQMDIFLRSGEIKNVCGGTCKCTL
ncbi:hypothetical protein GBAR_LOCUS24525 [Geodia barretti]|uniref:Uncharacterized protein n=2 Tax=Geodia barretti TaxID=519541 RepID=A0AA35TAA8_GEOBA|nr:hypothetical protein GBAR_LOCUS24525 [Geodia barretti]